MSNGKSGQPTTSGLPPGRSPTCWLGWGSKGEWEEEDVELSASVEGIRPCRQEWEGPLGRKASLRGALRRNTHLPQPDRSHSVWLAATSAGLTESIKLVVCWLTFNGWLPAGGSPHWKVY